MKIAIIGAGIAGMSAAYDLAQAGHQVVICEASHQVGGLASGFKEAHWDWSVEKYYHHWFASDKHMLGLIDELGLSQKVLFPRPFTVMNHKDKWYPFDSILQALLYPGLGWGFNKIRFGLAGVYLRLTKNWRNLEKVTAHEWMLKWVGKTVYQNMWEPMLLGKFGPYYRAVPMAWFWARIHARTTQLGTYQGGFQAFCDDFAEHLRCEGVEIKLKAAVDAISPQEQGFLLSLSGQGEHSFERVLSTTSPGLMARLAPALPPEYLQGLLNLKHLGAVVLTLSLKHQLSEKGYYWFNLPKNAGYPFLALVEHTNYVSSENFAGEIFG